MSLTRPKILAVDDKHANLVAVKRVLAKVDCEVILASSGNEALALTLEHEIALILLDINMPGMDGYEVAGCLKDEEATKDIPIIFLSALKETFDKVKAFEAGGVDYVSKPFEAEELLARVRTHLAIYQYRQDLADKNTELEESLTNLKKVQKSLVESEKMASLGLLTAGLAHEINNPLNFIINSSRALEKKLSKDAGPKLGDGEKSDVEIMLDNIISGSLRMAEIVRSLRIYSHSKIDNLEHANLKELVESAILILRPLHKKSIEIRCDYDEIPFLLCNPQRIHQVWVNVIKNAIEATKQNTKAKSGGIIHISARKCILKGKPGIRVEVADSGPGIDEESLPKIFDPFFTTKPVGEGTGLGLSICQGIIGDHGGDIRAHNNDGKGVVLTIKLPVNATDGGAKEKGS